LPIVLRELNIFITTPQTLFIFMIIIYDAMYDLYYLCLLLFKLNEQWYVISLVGVAYAAQMQYSANRRYI